MCQPRKIGTVGAEPFSAKLRYTGTDDPKHPNLIRVTVTMPHIDGMFGAGGRPATADEVKCNVVLVIFSTWVQEQYGSPNIDRAQARKDPLQISYLILVVLLLLFYSSPIKLILVFFPFVFSVFFTDFY